MKKLLILLMSVNISYGKNCVVKTNYKYKYQTKDYVSCLQKAKSHLGTIEKVDIFGGGPTPYGGPYYRYHYPAKVESLHFKFKTVKLLVKGKMKQ